MQPTRHGTGTRRKRKRRPPRPSTEWTIRYALIALVAVFALGAVEYLGVALFVQRGPARAGIAGILLDLTMLGALVPLHRRRPFAARELGLRRASPGASVGWVVLALVLVAAANVAWLQGVLGLPRSRSLGITLHGPTIGLVLAGIAIAAMAPVCEEIFFRGLLYRALRNRLGVPLAALAGGTIFALVHGLAYPLDTLPPRLVFGIVACLLYERTGSLLPGIALHMLVDAGAFEVAVSGHDRIVFPAFAALGLLLLIYAAGRRLAVPAQLPPEPANTPRLAGRFPPFGGRARR